MWLMQVLIVHNPTRRVKGKFHSYGVEFDTNSFVFDLTSADMEVLWAWIMQQIPRHSFRATLATPSTGKPGFVLRGLGEKSSSCGTLDGIQVKKRKLKHF